MTGSATRIPGEQRVFSLVLALVARPDGATKAELLNTVYGYSGENLDARALSARDRQFERDKAQLRDLGIPVEIIDSPGDPGNNQLARYRISKEQLQMPETVRFSDAELSLLRGAALAWQEGSLTAEARRSIIKLTSLGAHTQVQHIGVAPQLGIAEPAALALREALSSGLVARFNYQLPTRDTSLLRRVSPLGLHRADGRWHLIAHDLDRDEPRVFLLSRIIGEVRVGPEAIDESHRASYAETVRELVALENERRATLEVVRGSIAESRMLPRATTVTRQSATLTTIELGTLDFHVLASEIVRYGSEVRVVDPPRLQLIVRELLVSMREQHRDETPVSRNGAEPRKSEPGELR